VTNTLLKKTPGVGIQRIPLPKYTPGHYSGAAANMVAPSGVCK